MNGNDNSNKYSNNNNDYYNTNDDNVMSGYNNK